MELKFVTHRLEWQRVVLLIVPYGIEILHTLLLRQKLQLLLIVPYGIEIGEYASQYATFRLLIVPYGIEINVFLSSTANEKFF